MSNTEIKHALRKSEFPTCAKDSLIKIEQLLIGRASSIKHIDLAMDLMAEFVFSEVDRRGNRKSSSLTSLQEVQLLQILCDYFSGSGTEAVKNTVFLSLFGVSTLNLRIKILCKLVSMAVCIPSSAVLNAAGIWMQQLGNTSSHSLQLAKAIVNDYFIFIPSAVPRLASLPKIAPHFTANFLTAVSEMYLIEKRNCFVSPPVNLLETITEWVSEDYKLCTTAINAQLSLPTGAIHMAAITPLAGLLKWCILSPLQFTTNNVHKEHVSYTKLHLALLESLREAGPSSGPVSALSVQHLVTVLPLIQIKIGDLLKLERNIKREPSLQMSLDRLAQSIQVALSTRCLYGNIQDLLNQLDQLPENRLLRIVINTHKQIIL